MKIKKFPHIHIHNLFQISTENARYFLQTSISMKQFDRGDVLYYISNSICETRNFNWKTCHICFHSNMIDSEECNISPQFSAAWTRSFQFIDSPSFWNNSKNNKAQKGTNDRSEVNSAIRISTNAKVSCLFWALELLTLLPATPAWKWRIAEFFIKLSLETPFSSLFSSPRSFCAFFFRFFHPFFPVLQLRKEGVELYERLLLWHSSRSRLFIVSSVQTESKWEKCM